MSIRFICDSTCDYTEQQAKELGITLVPLKVLFEKKNILTAWISNRRLL